MFILLSISLVNLWKKNLGSDLELHSFRMRASSCYAPIGKNGRVLHIHLRGNITMPIKETFMLICNAWRLL
jgi:hypothetical protein